LPDSAAIDAGTNAEPDLPATDLTGDPRIADGDGDGSSVVDMGAYESSKFYPVADAGPDQTVDEGTTVTLDGSNSNDIDNAAVTNDSQVLLTLDCSHAQYMSLSVDTCRRRMQHHPDRST
jgi:hypothetical protein